MWTFGLVCVAWVFFRAESLKDALYILTHLHTGWFDFAERIDVGMAVGEICLSLGLIAFLMGSEFYQTRNDMGVRFAAWPGPARWAVYSLGLWAIFLLGKLQQNEFIYFVF